MYRYKKRGNHGGQRGGAGRPNGSLSKRALLQQAEMRSHGQVLPHVLLYQWAVDGRMPFPKGMPVPEGEDRPEYVFLGADLRIEALKACANYFAPKLIATAQVSDDQNRSVEYARIRELLYRTVVTVAPDRATEDSPRLIDGRATS